MIVLHGRNVNQIFPKAVQLLFSNGRLRDSRNGPVLQYDGPVSSVYRFPIERVLFNPLRNANPFFHLYESLWMLAGRNDVVGVAKYAANMANYSDHGETFHGAYGHRWRNLFKMDQLAIIAERLRNNRDDRRCVLQMWDAEHDLGREGKDFPCNTMATFQINLAGGLDLVVFCRSNDIIWGAYGANAVHFSFLLEYMAHWIGVPMGTMTQVSVNWHGYTEVLKKYEGEILQTSDHYEGRVSCFKMGENLTHEEVDHRIDWILFQDAHKFPPTYEREFNDDHPFWLSTYYMLRAYHLYKNTGSREDGIKRALDCLSLGDPMSDWIVAGKEWIERRA